MLLLYCERRELYIDSVDNQMNQHTFSLKYYSKSTTAAEDYVNCVRVLIYLILATGQFCKGDSTLVRAECVCRIAVRVI